MNKFAAFAGGLLFGTAGLKILSSRDAKKVYVHTTAAVLRAKDCVIPEGEEEKFYALPEEYSHLFLGVGGVLSAVICVKDPLPSPKLTRVSRYATARLSRARSRT